MKKTEPFSDHTLRTGPHGREVESQLRDFFHSEMPHPWPQPPQVRDELQILPLARQSAFRGNHARRYLALAASVALFLLGYWSLAGIFPAALPNPSFLNPDFKITKDLPVPDIDPDLAPHGMPSEVDPNQQGMQTPPRTIPTPSGEVRLYEQQLDNKTFMRLELLPKLPGSAGK